MTWVDLIQASFQRAPWGWGTLVVAIVALIKVWPLLSQQAIDERAAKRKERIELELQLRKEKRDDLGDCEEKLAAMDERLTAAEHRYHASELRLLGTLTAYRILEVEVEAKLPRSTALEQARAALKETFRFSPIVPPDMGGELVKMS